MISTDRPIETPAARPVLGIAAKSLHAARNAKKAIFSNPDAALAAKSLRYTLQRAAAGLLFDPARPISDQIYRVTGCHRDRKGEKVGLYRAIDGSDSRITGVVTCGSVWHCPVCAAKVTEARRIELQAALVWHQQNGGEAYLMTLTHPHTFDMRLADQLEKQADARQRFKNCRTFKRVMAKYGRLGSVCSLETTYGVNGHHPHTHDLIFAQPGLMNDARAIAELRAEWIRILIKVGLGDSDKLNDMHAHAFDLAGGNFAAEYIAKFGREPFWSEAHELTKSHAKIGQRTLNGKTHFTPFQLLQWYLNEKDDEERAKLAGAFIEYAEAFQGKRMLSWSPGLKEKLHVEELTDEEIAADESPKVEEEGCGDLDKDQWGLILSRNARGELLTVLARNGREGVDALLYDLEHNRRPTHRGASDSHRAWSTKLDYYSYPKKAA